MANTALEITRKDLTAEFRTKRNLTSMLLFSVMVILAFRFAFSVTGVGAAVVAPAALWITFILAGMFALSAAFSTRHSAKVCGCLSLVLTIGR